MESQKSQDMTERAHSKVTIEILRKLIQKERKYFPHILWFKTLREWYLLIIYLNLLFKKNLAFF